jgi:hypothetical protein
VLDGRADADFYQHTTRAKIHSAVCGISEEHIGDAANLYLKVVRGQARQAPRSLRDAFRETLLDNPWASPEIPSLVYLDSGKLVGFLGVIPRPMEFRGRPIRAATIALWMVDGASNDASSALASAGARISYLYSFNWVCVLRPFGLARNLFEADGRSLADAEWSFRSGRCADGLALVEGSGGHVSSPGIGMFF